MKFDVFSRLAMIATVLALCVVVLGAYVRLSHAGLGCPDWPGCYGHMDVPKTAEEIQRANALHPDRPVEAHKAWKEMIHRYFAGILGLLVFTLAYIGWRNRRRPGQQVRLPLFLSVLIIFQALLGMWTVTIKLNPTIVMLHLMGGLATLSILWWLVLRQSGLLDSWADGLQHAERFRKLALVGLVIVILQLMLGGWTSANYAALHCPDFPTCQGQWLPPTDFGEAFTLWRGTELNFEGGVLDNDARVTIHVMHRLGALITLLFIGSLALMLLLGKAGKSMQKAGLVLMSVLLVQISLGIANVLLSLPLLVAVAHNGVGALLLLTMLTLTYLLFREQRL